MLFFHVSLFHFIFFYLNFILYLSQNPVFLYTKEKPFVLTGKIVQKSLSPVVRFDVLIFRVLFSFCLFVLYNHHYKMSFINCLFYYNKLYKLYNKWLLAYYDFLLIDSDFIGCASCVYLIMFGLLNFMFVILN